MEERLSRPVQKTAALLPKRPQRRELVSVQTRTAIQLESINAQGLSTYRPTVSLLIPNPNEKLCRHQNHPVRLKVWGTKLLSYYADLDSPQFFFSMRSPGVLVQEYVHSGKVHGEHA